MSEFNQPQVKSIQKAIDVKSVCSSANLSDDGLTQNVASSIEMEEKRRKQDKDDGLVKQKETYKVDR